MTLETRNADENSEKNMLLNCVSLTLSHSTLANTQKKSYDLHKAETRGFIYEWEMC